MKNIHRKLSWCAFVAYMSAPAIVQATPWDNANSPLWLGSAVKHNVMFAIDDSGSMDFEVLFDNNDGAIYLNNNGFFADSSGNLYSGGSKYTYLFPNGYNNPYNGKRRVGGHYAIPPIPAYAFARNVDYNRSYYNPAVDYEAWEVADEYTSDATKQLFSDADLDKTLFEPVSSLNFNDGGAEGGLNLFAMHDTADESESQWAFDIEDGDMACDDDGNTCSTGQRDYPYYPATYYLKDTSGEYYYHASASTTPFTVVSSDSILFEAEPVSGLLQNGADSYGSPIQNKAGIEATDAAMAAAAAINASGKDFLGTRQIPGTDNNTGDNPEPTDENGALYTFKFDSPKTVNIWVRIWTPNGGSDSFYMRLKDKEPDPDSYYDQGSALTLGPGFIVPDDWQGADDNWSKWWRGIGTGSAWEWKLWATVDVAATEHELEIRRRESGAYFDQILITSDTALTPVGILTDASSPTTTGVLRSCSTDTLPAHYQEFVRFPERFQKTEAGDVRAANRFDAIAPDGSCLKKYEIAGTDGDKFDNGVATVDDRRTVLEEKQNFANWFMYYRKRHQAMRGGLAEAMDGIGGIKTGMFWINNRRTVGETDMWDMDTSTGIKDFLSDHLETVNSGGTPLRAALNHARNQYVSSTGPVTSECQKNYTLLFTDGFSSKDPVSGIGNEDKDAVAPYADTYSSTLADVAYKAYNDRLRAGDFSAGEVQVPDACGEGTAEAWEDCNTDLHMNTYTVGLGARGTLYGVTHNTIQDAYTNSPSWPDVTATRDSTQIDDLYHAAVNGRGGMYNAASPNLLGAALGAALSDITASIGSGSSVTFNSSSLRAGSAVFLTLFNSADWTGNVGGISLSGDGSLGDAVWTDSSGNATGAAAILNERNLTTDPRFILTWGISDTSKTPYKEDGVLFEWDNLTDAQKLDLKTNPDGSVRQASYPFAEGDADYVASEATDYDADADGIARLSFLRGNIQDDMEITSFSSGLRKTFELRDRFDEDANLPQRMADIVHSTPVYVGAPASSWPDKGYFGAESLDANGDDDGSERYSAFVQDKKDRPPMVYVGTNGGMLQGFNATIGEADSGQETFAYIPESVFSANAGEGMHYLTQTDYSHKYYVDLPSVTQDVYTSVDGQSGSTKSWRTMLLGGLRGGGRAIFALDVTDPAGFSDPLNPTPPEDIVMWEFSNDDDADLGYLLNPPIIAMMNNGKWAAIFGNGHDSDAGRAKLFILYIEEGLDGEWSATDYVKIDTGVGSSVNKNGMSGISAWDSDGDSVVDRVYAGDLYGNMWAFDVSDSNTSKWEIAHKQGSTYYPLFTATDGSSNRQPITGAPNLILNTEQVGVATDPNILVTFGTGQYLNSTDEVNQAVQSYYAVWDVDERSLDRSDLVVRELETVTAVVEGEVEAVGVGVKDTAVDVDWTTNKGWYFDFKVDGVANGERLVFRPRVRVDKVIGPFAFFNSTIPSTSECSGGGSSRFYTVPLLTGKNPEKGLLDLDDDGQFDTGGIGINLEDMSEMECIGSLCIGGDSESQVNDISGDNTTSVETGAELGSARTGRLGWNELVND